MKNEQYVYGVLMNGGYVVLHSYAGVANWSLYDPNQKHEKYVTLNNLHTLVNWFLSKGIRLDDLTIRERGAYFKYYYIEGKLDPETLK
ncbi:hypothetical protein [Vibrio phage Va2]|nr:hypothetical protein [Vibrio phage Va2]